MLESKPEVLLTLNLGATVAATVDCKCQDHNSILIILPRKIYLTCKLNILVEFSDLSGHNIQDYQQSLFIGNVKTRT